MNILKTKDIIDKIKQPNQLINEGNISTLLSKLVNNRQNHSPEELSLRFQELPSVLLNWINKYQDKTSADILLKAIQIVQILTSCVNGAKLFDKYGAIEFFYEFKNFLGLKADLKPHLVLVEEILRNIVQLRDLSEQQYTLAQPINIKSNQGSNHNLHDIEADNARTVKSSRNDLRIQEEDQYLSFNQNQQTLNNNAQKLESKNGIDNLLRQHDNNSSSFSSSLNQRVVGQSFNRETLNGIRGGQLEFEETIKKIQILERPKQEVIKEFKHLPHMELSESDDKFLFDIGVQLKFSEQSIQYDILTEILPNIIKDYPVEIFRRKNEIIQELVFIQLRATSQLFVYHSIQNQIAIIKKIVKTFKQVDSGVYQDLNISKAAQMHLKDEKTHIKYCYPSLKKPSFNPEDQNSLSKTYSGQWTFYQIIEFICSSTFENIKSNIFVGLVCSLLAEVTSALNYLKTINLPATRSLLFEVLSKFSIVIEQKRVEIYEELSNLCLLIQIRNLFCVLKPEDYQSEGSNKLLDQLYYYIFNPQLRCIYSKKQFDELYAYVDIFGKSNVQSDRKLLSLLESLEILKKFDNEINQYAEGVGFVQLKEYQLFVENISKLVQALPFTNQTKYPKLYLDTLLYTIAEKPTKPSGDLYYQDVRKYFIQIANIPTKLSHLVFQEILSYINRANRFINTKSGQQLSLQNLICQSLLDPYFASQLILAGLSKQENISLILQIIHQFCTLYFKQSNDVGVIDHIYRFISVFNQLQYAENEAISKNAELLTDILRNKSEESWVHLITLDLFSKHPIIRKKAYAILRNEQLLRNTYLQRDTTHFVARLLIEHKKDESTNYEDVLAPFLNEQQTLISYFDKSLQFNLKKTVQVNLEDISNLYQVIIGENVEIKLKQSAVEQLIEKLTYLESKQYVQQEIQNLVILLIQYSISVIETSPSIPFRTSMLALLSAFLCNFKQFAKLRFQVLLCLSPAKQASLKYSLLTNLVSQDKDLRYYSLKMLYALCLNNNYLYYRNIQEKFNQNSEFNDFYAHILLKDQYIDFKINLSYKSIDENQIEIWKIYPLNDFEDYYVQKYLEAQSADSLYSKNISDLQQSFIIQNTNDNIVQQDYSKCFGVLTQWFDYYCGLTHANRTEEFFTGFVCELFIKILSSEYSQMHVNYTYTIIRHILKQTDINEYKYNIPLNTLIHDIISFLSTTTLSYVYQIPTLNLKDKAQMIVPFFQCLIAFQKFIHKQADPKLKHILTKKILKQTFMDLMMKFFNAFPHNQTYFDTLVKFQTVLLDQPESLDFDINSFMKYIMEQLLIMYKPTFEFMYKSKLKNILIFFLKYLSLFSSSQYITEAMQRSTLVASKKNLLKASTLGWILKYTDDRCTQIRVLSWNILLHLIEPKVLKIYKSIVELAVDVVMSPNEAFGVVICAARVLSKALQVYEEESDFENNDENDRDISQQEDIHEEYKNPKEVETRFEISEVLNVVNGKNLISHVKFMIEKEGAPEIFYANAINLLYRITRLDRQKSIGIMSQLELFDKIVQLLDKKYYERPGKIAPSDGKDRSQINSERLMSVSLTCNFLTFILTLDKNQQNYLINGTNMLGYLLKWLKAISNSYIQPQFQTSFKNKKALDDSVNSIVKLLHTCIIFNEDITVFSINKRMQEKIKDKVTDESEIGNYINIFRSLSYIIEQSKNDEMKRTCLQFIGQLLGGWRQKGSQLIDSKDFNQEIIGENLALQTYRQYKLLNHLFIKQEIEFQSFKQERNNVLSALASILSCSNYSKQAFVCSGFYQDIIRELYSVLDNINVETQTVFNVTTTSNKQSMKRKTAKESNIAVKYNEKPIDSSDCLYYIRLFKALFCDKEDDSFQFDKIMETLQKSSTNLLEILYKLLLLSIRNEDEYFDAYSRMITNFSSHKVFSKILCLRLVDNRSQQILTDIQANILKLDGITKNQFKHCMKILEVLGQNEEIRKVYYRQKFIDQVNQKIFEIWNKKREWNPNNYFVQYFIHFLLALSFHQDSHQRLFIENNIFDTLIAILQETKCRGKLSEMILLLHCNVSISSECKVFYTSKENQMAALMLSVVSSDSNDLLQKDIICQMFVNLLYKCNQAIIMFNKPEIVQELQFVQSEIQRQIDKIQIGFIHQAEENKQSQGESQYFVNEKMSEEMQHRKNIVANLTHIQQILATVW
ncbi:hypothetical protein ABPG72_003081 [Tetrahymena utriculariae]